MKNYIKKRMKPFNFLMIVLLSFYVSHAQNAEINDTNLLNALIAQGIDTNNDGIIQIYEAESVTTLEINDIQINSLNGICAFSNVTKLQFSNNQLTTLDLSCFPDLTNLICISNNITTLDFSNNLKIEQINCFRAGLNVINLGSVTTLKSLQVHQNNLTTIDLSNAVNLEYFRANQNKLTQLDLSKNIGLKTLIINENEINTISFTNNQELKEVNLNKNKLTTINTNPLINIEKLDLGYNKFTSLEIEKLVKLNYFNCSNNFLTTLKIENLPLLTTFACVQNQLDSLDLSSFTQLTIVNCNNNRLDYLNIKSLSSLSTMTCYDNQLITIPLQNNTNLGRLECHNNKLTILDVTSLTKLWKLYCQNNPLTTICVNSVSAIEGNSFFIKDVSADWSETCYRCQNYELNDTTTFYVSDSTFQKVKENIYFNDTEKLVTTIGIGICDSIVHHYYKFVYKAVQCTDTSYITVEDTLNFNIIITNNQETILSEIKVYPNPTKDHLYVSYDRFEKMQSYQIQITNSLGEEVFLENVQNELTKIDVFQLGGKGLYFLKIYDPKQQEVTVKKIVIN